MLPIEMSRAQQSRAHLLTLKGLNGSMEFPTNPQEAASAALAELAALHSNGYGLNYAHVFTLAEAVLAYRDEHCKTAAARYDVLSLSRACGCSSLAQMAIRLCGAYPTRDGNGFVDGDGVSTVVTFPADLWTKHLHMLAEAH